MAVDISIVNISGKENTREEVALYNYMLPNLKNILSSMMRLADESFFTSTTSFLQDLLRMLIYLW